ncbi:shikimate kinase AroK [Thiofaba sp. EF100]|uniref:shikimate kinase AroK n=1 Tax=Thiofaba sp. EF100 TaxID=3121274 RepID=UPI003221E4A9
MTPSIFLVGPMGAGKSTSGRLLARTLGLTFIDSDKVIEERTGASIPLIFELEGEAGFRARERAVIDDLTREAGIVLATGGGAILAPENREVLRSRGKVVYLHASVDHQMERTAHDRNRPLLQTPDRRGKLEELMKIREPLYRETAHLVVETDGLAPKTVVQRIIRGLRLDGRS